MVSVEEAFAKTLRVYPNPVRSGHVLRLASVDGDPLPTSAVLLSADARTSRHLPLHGGEAYLPDDLPPGMYVLRTNQGAAARVVVY